MDVQEVTAVGPDVTNGAQSEIDTGLPYIVSATVIGVADILFHRWNCEAVEAKSKAAKGSAAKKTDNIESYVYRNDAGELCVPGEYLRQSMINAAKYRQDPRSPRKSAMDLYKAGIVPLSPLASLGVTKWEYEHKCKVSVQRNGITRTRPAMKAGWQITVDMMVNLPEYIPIEAFNDVLVNAGRLVGLGDYRPTYGRFRIVRLDVLPQE